MQLCSSDDIQHNLHTIKQQLQACADQQCELVVLPENAALMTLNTHEKHLAIQGHTSRFVMAQYAKMAKTHHIWLVAGSMLIQDNHNPNKAFNASLVFSPDGELMCRYDKIHLFDADLERESWHESAFISAGYSPQTQPLDDVWRLGLSICYDLRFPELYRYYQAERCNIITVPAAFTVPTGQAHWEVLLRARAIENQCYVLAAAQSGQHADGRSTHGHSMIINPWGEVLSCKAEGVGMIVADLSWRFIQHISQQMSVFGHRKIR